MTYAQTTQDVKLAVSAIQQGRLVAFPTGTSYGLAADALQGHALQRLRNLKKRPDGKTFSVFMAEKLYPVFLNLTTAEEKFLRHNTNKHLTVLIQPKPALQHLAQDGLVALRLIDHPFMQKLADQAQVPLTATSANLSGQNACYDPACVLQNFPGRLGDTTYDLSLGIILDGQKLPPRPPSSLVKIINGQPSSLPRPS